MTQTASTLAQVEIDGLPSLCASLTAALSGAGFNNGQLGEIFSQYVSAECPLAEIFVA